MIFRNIDAPQELAVNAVMCKSYVEGVMTHRGIPVRSKKFDIECVPMKHMTKNFKVNAWTIPENQNFSESVSYLLHTIPFYFRKERSKDSTGDLLGMYISGKGVSSPYIELYLSTLNSACNNIKEFKWLLTMTILHELMHAVMDIYNQAGFYNKSGKYIGPQELISYQTQYGRWKEESLANAGTLKLIWRCRGRYSAEHEDYDRRNYIAFYEFIKDFMSKQPYEYTLGIQISFLQGNDMFYDYVLKKINGVSSAEQSNWLANAKNQNDSWLLSH